MRTHLYLTIAVTFIMAALLGCSPQEDATAEGPLPVRPTAQKIEQARTIMTPKSLFWLSGLTYGCHAPGRGFAVYRFTQNGVDTHNGKNFDSGAVHFSTLDGSFTIEANAGQSHFRLDRARGGISEGHIIRYLINDAPATCYLMREKKYLPSDGSNGHIYGLQGNWTCNGKLNAFNVDGAGIFSTTGFSGSSVISSASQDPENASLHILSGLDKIGIPSAIYILKANLSKLSEGRLLLDGELCTKQAAR